MRATDDGFILQTPRLELHELRLGIHEPFVLELLNEPGFVKYVGDKGIRTIEDAAGYIETQRESYRLHQFGLYLVERRDSGDAIGICGLLRRPPIEDVEVGFGYLERAWGHGFAFEAATAMIAFGFETLELPRIIGLTDPRNDGSISVLRKLGMRFEGMVPLAGFDLERDLFAIDRARFSPLKSSADQQE